MVFSDYIQLAVNEAINASKWGAVPVGALVVRNGMVISSAHNEKKVSSQKSLPKTMQHAELLAMIEACHALNQDRLDGCDVFSTLEPCFTCFSAIMMMRVSRVIFGAYDLKKGALSLGLGSIINAQDMPEVFGGFLEDECSSLLKTFFKTKRSHSDD